LGKIRGTFRSGREKGRKKKTAPRAVRLLGRKRKKALQKGKQAPIKKGKKGTRRLMGGEGGKELRGGNLRKKELL